MYNLFPSRARRLANFIGASNWRLLAVVTLLTFAGLATAEQEEKSMQILLNTPAARDYQKVALDVQPIGSVPTLALDPAPPAPAPDYRARYGSSARNGRVDVSLPEGEWADAWSYEVRKGMLPQTILSSGDRVLVQTGVWQLFDLEGKLLKEGNSGPSAVAMDPDHGRFYHMNRTGDIVGRNLSDGEPVFAAMPFLGSEFSRPLIRCYGARMLLIGIERQLDPHGHHKASRSLLEWIDLGDPLEVSGSGLLLSARNAGTLIFPTTSFLSAADAESVVCASPDHIYLSTLAPELNAVFGGEFEPIALSLGGNGIAYLIVHSAGERHLWRMAKDGTRVQSTLLPDGIGPLVAPPLVGAEGQIYLAASNRIEALDPQGAPRWTWNSPLPLVGATCTKDGSVVVVTQRELGLLRDGGTYHRIYRSVDAPFYTSPCVTRDGAIVVASANLVQAFRCE